MTITVRTITDAEVAAYVDAMNVGFHTVTREGEAELRRGGIAPERTHAAFDGDRIVGTTRCFATELTLPGGGTLPASAVTNVAVIGTHRRQGVLTQMMRAHLDDVIERREPLAILISAEAPIYGRFGYGSATKSASVRIDPTEARFAVRPPTADRVRFSDRTEMRKLAPPVHDRHRATWPGSIGRTDRMWDFRFGVLHAPDEDTWKKQLHVIHEGDDGADGYATYHVEDRWNHRFPDNTVHVDELMAVTTEAYAALWHHTLGLDLVRKVVAEERPVEEPLPWLLTDPRQVDLVHLSDFLWVRVLDVPATLAARSYAATDRLVFEVVDPFCPASGGRFELDAGPDGATCEPTEAAPDVSVGTAELGAASLGGAPLWLPAAAGRVTEHTSGAVARFDRLFLGQPGPWCNTWF
ncbi:MAG: GNAT family N-acetyltransferase [Acidimicrobiales bacterium]